MGDGTKIEWADETWNPIVGCSKTSPGCDNCYAIGVAHRGLSPQHKGLTVRTEDGTDWTGEVRFVESVLDKPLRWKKPRRIFVNSLSDLFHPDVPDHVIFAIWRVMAMAPQHTFQVLTKRPQRMREWFGKLDDRGSGPPSMLGTPEEEAAVMSSGRAVMFEAMVDSWGDPPEGAARPFYDWAEGERWWPTVLPNVWLGTSIESDKYSFRADYLRATPAAVRFVSAEPLLGPLPSLDLTGIDWLIVGGESGPGARPMHPDWVRDLRDRCINYRCLRCSGSFSLPLGWACPDHHPERTAFLFKQHGSFRTSLTAEEPDRKPTMWVRRYDGVTVANEDLIGDGMDWTAAYRMPKHEAGRTLDGRTWDEFPDDRVSRKDER